MYLRVATVFSCILVHLHSVLGSVDVKYQFISFHSNGRDIQGECCDPLSCSCEPRFRLCFDIFDGSNSLSECAYGVYSSGEHDRNSFQFNPHTLLDGVNNPIEFTVSKWETGVKLKVWVRDDDSGHSDHDTMDRYYEPWQGTPTPWGENAQQHRQTYYGTRTRTEQTTVIVDVTASCSPHYYGALCDVYCPNDDYATSTHSCQADDPNMGEQTGDSTTKIAPAESTVIKEKSGISGLIIGLICGIFVAILVVIVAIAAVYRHKRKLKMNGENNAAHAENPMYSNNVANCRENVYSVRDNAANYGASGVSRGVVLRPPPYSQQPVKLDFEQQQQRANEKAQELEGGACGYAEGIYDNPSDIDADKYTEENIYEIPLSKLDLP